jgi:hypothetical protein
LFLISDEDVVWEEDERASEIELRMAWSEDLGFPGLKVSGERVTVSGSTEGFGVIIEEEECNTLVWHWRPDPDKKGEFEIFLEAIKQISVEDLVTIAESLKQ